LTVDSLLISAARPTRHGLALRKQSKTLANFHHTRGNVHVPTHTRSSIGDVDRNNLPRSILTI